MNKKITELGEMLAAGAAVDDVLPVADVSGTVTNKFKLSSLSSFFVNAGLLPSISHTHTAISNGSGNVTVGSGGIPTITTGQTVSGTGTSTNNQMLKMVDGTGSSLGTVAFRRVHQQGQGIDYLSIEITSASDIETSTTRKFDVGLLYGAANVYLTGLGIGYNDIAGTSIRGNSGTNRWEHMTNVTWLLGKSDGSGLSAWYKSDSWFKVTHNYGSDNVFGVFQSSRKVGVGNLAETDILGKLHIANDNAEQSPLVVEGHTTQNQPMIRLRNQSSGPKKLSGYINSYFTDATEATVTSRLELASAYNGTVAPRVGMDPDSLFPYNSGVSMSLGNNSYKWNNLYLNGIASISDSSTVPSGTPVAGGFLYSYSGQLYWKDSSGYSSKVSIGPPAIVTVTAASNVAATTDRHQVNSSSSTTQTLPTSCTNRLGYITIKNLGTGTITIAASSGTTIESPASLTITTQGNSLDYYLDGTVWREC